MRMEEDDGLRDRGGDSEIRYLGRSAVCASKGQQVSVHHRGRCWIRPPTTGFVPGTHLNGTGRSPILQAKPNTGRPCSSQEVSCSLVKISRDLHQVPEPVFVDWIRPAWECLIQDSTRSGSSACASRNRSTTAARLDSKRCSTLQVGRQRGVQPLRPIEGFMGAVPKPPRQHFGRTPYDLCRPDPPCPRPLRYQNRGR